MPRDIEGDIVGKTSDDKILRKRGYQLGKVLGEGSYAKVYLADYYDGKDNTEKKQRLACKVINGAIAPKDFLRRFFPREVEIMSRVNHVYLVRVHSILQRKQKYFLFMQFCENGDLLDFIRKNGAIRERQARVWFCQILRGVHYLHERNIAHRDMKCENILLTASYNIKISDFGFARYVLPEDPKSDTFCGSVSYAPPEIIKGVSYDPKAVDVWSIGVILFAMLNKSLPFDETSLKKLYDSQVSRKWKFRDKLKDLLSVDVKNYLYATLEPDQERRKSVAELWDEPWIQKGSNIDLNIKPQGGGKSMTGKNEYTDAKHREKIAQEKVEKDLAQDLPIQIIDADTAKGRNASFYLKDYQDGQKSGSSDSGGKPGTSTSSPSFIKPSNPAKKLSNDDDEDPDHK